VRSQFSSEFKLLGFLALPCKSIRECYTRPIPGFRLVLPQTIAHHPAPATTASRSHCDVARGFTLPSTGNMSRTDRMQTRA